MINNLQVIVGKGVTGQSCARFFESKNIPYEMIDTRTDDVTCLSKAARIIVSPGIPLNTPEIQAAIKRGVPVIGDVELFAETQHKKVVSITGTNAKSTVTTLVGLMAEASGLSVQTGGNLGVPVLDLYLNNPNADVFVLELSSFQLETIFTLKSTVATILNISPDHMDRYDSYEDYQAAKHRVYLNAEVAVCNHDDALTDTASDYKFYFTLKKPGEREFGLITEDDKTYLAYENKLLMPVADLPVRGKHYQANALAALALGYGLGLKLDAMLTVLREFPGLPHRCQFVRQRNNINWYNDSKGTNVGATEAAICGLGGDIKDKLVIIAGGVGKSADFSPLIPLFKRYARHVVLIGEAKDTLASLINGVVPISFADSMEEAILQSDQAAHPGDAVLLSPACASFDMFKNYEHRGDVFMEIVNRL